MESLKPVKKEVVKVDTDTKNYMVPRWYNLDPKEDFAEIGPAAWQDAQNINLLQQGRQADYWNYARMYGNRGLGFSNVNYTSGPSQLSKSATDVRLKLNAARACVDACTSKIAQQKPRPVFLTSNGDWNQKKKAQKLTQYLDGAYDMANVYEEATEVFRDACIFNLGAMYVYIDSETSTVKAERVWVEEIIVDEAEAQYGKPKKLSRSKLVHRDDLLKQYGKDPDLKIMIMGAATPTYITSTAKDLIQVIESWYLGDNGKRVICIKEGTLLAEPYTKSYFPFVFFTWQKGLRSFWGQGIIEQVFNIQLEINQTCQTIQQSLYFCAVPRVYLNTASKVVEAHLDNRIGSIVKYSGNVPPQFSTPQANNPEMYTYLQYLYNKVFETIGASELSASSKKPPGLDSGVALREFSDIESSRFTTVGQAWEQFFMDLAKVFVDLSKDLYTKDKSLAVKYKNNKFLESIKWSDVEIAEDDYVLRCFPTSILPTQPAGRLQFVQELIQSGFIDKEIGLDLLDYPDLDRAMSIKNAGADNAMMILEKIVDEGKYESPEPYMNLKLCIELGQGMYLKARNDNVPEERLELLRRFIDDCNALSQVPAPVVPATNIPTPEIAARPEALPRAELAPQVGDMSQMGMAPGVVQ